MNDKSKRSTWEKFQPLWIIISFVIGLIFNNLVSWLSIDKELRGPYWERYLETHYKVINVVASFAVDTTFDNRLDLKKEYLKLYYGEFCLFEDSISAIAMREYRDFVIDYNTLRNSLNRDSLEALIQFRTNKLNISLRESIDKVFDIPRSVLSAPNENHRRVNK